MEAKPETVSKETALPRPDLYLIIWRSETTGQVKAFDGIWLRKGEGKVCVKEPTTPKRTQNPIHAGKFQPGAPQGPAYTGPIDDETMANILMYGG